MSLLLALLLASQEKLTVLEPEDQPKKMLETYLLGECAKQFDARRKAVAALKTPEDIAKRQQELRTKFIAALGGFPEKTPLNGRVTGKADRDGYRIEKVIYESRPNHHVTAILYLPEGKGPFPGAIMPMGHSTTGKAADYAQRGSILLAKNGIACLNYDPIGQGERMQLLDDQGKPAIKGSTGEHTAVGTGALLVGWSAASYRIWDGIRSLDYLASRPEIDPKRLGCTGCSGGGTLTSYLMALDERIVAAAPSCYITSLERLFATIGPQDAEQNITGQVAFGMEHADYILLHAPRPTLLLTGTRDFFDIQGAWTTFREAKNVYGVLGHAERMDLSEFDQTHGYPKNHREGAVRWMRRWLLGVDDAITEPEFPIAKEQDLWCTETGQVLSALKGKSAFDLTAEREKELAAKRGKLSNEELLKEVRKRIGLPAVVPEATASPRHGDVRRDTYTIAKGTSTVEPGIKLPYLLFAPDRKKAGPKVLYVSGEGKSAASTKGGLLDRWAQEGQVIVALDLRGMGETAGSDFKDAFLGFHLNRPLLGQRTQDLLAVLADLSGECHLFGSGTAAPAALHAAALEPKVSQLTLERMVISWSSVARTPMSRNQLSNVVPGALEAYDLPDLAAAIAPRPLTIRGAVDAAGKPVSQEDLESAYARAREAYKAAGAEKALVLEAKP
jgi:dienelactone hydrolase/pimeloyl-ACP methyl ester carboxylesterase